MPRESSIGKTIHEVETPCFLVDLKVVKQNCTMMLKRAENAGIQLRGHVKTHKTIEGAIIQTDGRKRCIVTSTLEENEFYAEAGFDDILYAYPILPTHMKRNYKLMEKLEEYHLLVTSKQSVMTLLSTPPPDKKKWSVFMSIDCGNKREGLWWSDEECVQVAEYINNNQDKIILQGLYTHCGNSYLGKTCKLVEELRDETIHRLKVVKNNLKDAGIFVTHLGIGSTPSCSLGNDVYKDLTEIHPGNYVFYDVQQSLLGSCTLSDIACCVATRVIGHSSHHGHMIIDCGFTGLTKQGYEQMDKRHAFIKDHSELALVSMTQEIGTIKAKDGGKLNFDEFPIGAMLYLLPYHSCATAAMYPVYSVHENGVVVEKWKPIRGW